MKRSLIVLLLLAIALPMIVIAGSSNVTAQVASTPTPTTVPSFFTCVFGVHIFPGADPMGTYTVNLPEGSVSGHYVNSNLEGSVSVITVYLSNTKNLWYSENGLQGVLIQSNMPVGSYITKLDGNGNYVINNVAFGQYYVYWSSNPDAVINGSGIYAGSADLTAAAPHAVVDLQQLVF